MNSGYSFFRRARETIVRLGFGTAMIYALSRFAGRVSGGHCRVFFYEFVAQPVAQSSGLRKSADITVEMVGMHDAVVRQFPRPAEVIDRRFAEEANCFAAKCRGNFAGYLWLKLDGYDEDEVRCRYVPIPESRTAWDFDVYVDPAYRMTRTFSHMWRAANEFLAARGVENVLSRISAYNPASLRAHQRMGARRVARALFLCMGSFQLMLASIWPLVHVSFGAGSRPMIRLASPTRKPFAADV